MTARLASGGALLALLAAAAQGDGDARTLDAYLDRTYYTSEAAARVLVPAGETGRDGGASAWAAIRTKEGKTLAAAEAPITPGARETPVRLLLKGVPAGRWPVRVELRDAAKRVLAARTLTLRKHPPAPKGAAEVKIDQENRALLVDGRPLLPVGIWTGHLTDDWLRLYKQIGFNTLLLWQGPGQDRSVRRGREQLDRIREHGLWAIPRPLTFVKRYGGLRTNAGMLRGVEEMRGELQALRDHPAVLVYYGLDEAPADGMAEGLSAFLRTCRQVDPYHPVYLSSSTPSRMRRYDFADIHGRHAYWCPMGAAAHRTPNRPARVAAWAQANVAEPNRRPLFFVPQGEITSHSRRGLTPAERRITVYLALIHAAKAILYFRAPILHRATVRSMKALSAEMHVLAPALLRRRRPQEIRVTPAPPHRLTSPSKHQYDLPIVQAALLDRPGGGSVLLAANSSPEPVAARWDLGALGRRLRVWHLFTKKPCSIRGGILKDRLDGYATRAYLIEGGSPDAGGKAVVGVRLTGPAVAAAAAPDEKWPKPRTGKNMLYNSSFEQAALPGWPDSWWFGYPSPSRMCGDPDGPGQDARRPYHGKFSLRVVNPHASRSGLVTCRYRHSFPNTYLRGGVPVTKGRPYTFSAYLRADKPHTPVDLHLCNYARNSCRYDEGARRRVELTADWRRYELTATYPPKGWKEGHRPEFAIVLRHRGPGGSFWIDAAQLEQGKTATAYEP